MALLSLTGLTGGWAAQGVLENPAPASVQSGIALISGWVCEGTEIIVTIDELPPLRAAHGTTRADTREACGDDDNGFGLTWNWNLVGDGLHTVRVLVDGEELGRATFTVATLGVGEFARGLIGQSGVADFPQSGTSTQLQWQESLQNFVIRGEYGGAGGGTSGVPPHVLENPSPGSLQSGITLISGWACEAGEITIVIDELPPLRAAHGTTRADTREVCGDDDNGFGLTWNWNLVGDGEHRVQAFADGAQFADVTFTVTTLGAEFLRDTAGDGTVGDFPGTGTTARVRWQEAQQNFMIEGVVPGDRAAALCGTRSGRQASTGGGTVLFAIHNPCTLAGTTLDLEVSFPPQIEPEDVFRVCPEQLTFEQDGMVFTAPEDFQWVDGRGDEVCRELRPGERMATIIAVNPGVPLTFSRPFRIVHNGEEVAEFAEGPEGCDNAPAIQLTARWVDASDNEEGFKVERKTGTAGIFAQIGVTGADSTTYVDPGLAAGTTYCYRVRAYNAAGESAYSNEACGTMPTGGCVTIY